MKEVPSCKYRRECQRDIRFRPLRHSPSERRIGICFIVVSSRSVFFFYHTMICREIPSRIFFLIILLKILYKNDRLALNVLGGQIILQGLSSVCAGVLRNQRTLSCFPNRRCRIRGRNALPHTSSDSVGAPLPIPHESLRRSECRNARLRDS